MICEDEMCSQVLGSSHPETSMDHEYSLHRDLWGQRANQPHPIFQGQSTYAFVFLSISSIGCVLNMLDVRVISCIQNRNRQLTTHNNYGTSLDVRLIDRMQERSVEPPACNNCN